MAGLPPASKEQSHAATLLLNKATVWFQRGLLSQTAPLDFAQDCKTGRLPAVSWINSQYLFTGHPPTPIDWSQYAISQVLSALTLNPDLWAKTVLFLTWDDSGGFFDHVPPPVAPMGTPGEYLTALPPSGGSASSSCRIRILFPTLPRVFKNVEVLGEACRLLEGSSRFVVSTFGVVRQAQTVKHLRNVRTAWSNLN